MEYLNTWAIVPVKPFKQAKSRLSSALSPDQREALAQHLFRQCLHLLLSVKKFSGVLVVSRDSKALAIAHDYHAHTIQESGEPELNPALTRAAQILLTRNVQSIFVMPADLPFVTLDDIEQILHLGRFLHSAVIVPDSVEDGTNSLMLTPPNLIPFAFGAGSFNRHKALIEQTGASLQIYRSERMGLDLDMPADLDRYQAMTTTREIPVVELDIEALQRRNLDNVSP